MRDVVVVPCYERPEYTRVALEYLSRARGIQDKEVWLCQDCHGGDSRERLAAAMEPNYLLGFDLFPDRFSGVFLGPHNTYGNSKNIFASLKMAYEAGAERIFLVEDDIMVAPDFFEWHEAILEEVDPVVSCASALNKSAHFQINGPEAIDESIKDLNAYRITKSAYSSHAVAFKRQNLKWVLKYFENDSSDVWFAPGREQDILVQTFFKDSNCLTAAWPFVPRAFNVGMYSYHINTAMKFNGTLEEKCDALRKAIVDPEKLRSMSGGNQAITPVPTEFAERTGPLVRR